MRHLLGVAIALALCGATPAAPAGGGASALLTGTLTLTRFDQEKACKFTRLVVATPVGPLEAGSKALLAQCSVTGTYSGSPEAGTGGYGWNWYLALGRRGNRTGAGAEFGNVALHTASGTIELRTRGTQHAVGAQSRAYARGKTTGTWTAVRASGSGTYTFVTERRGNMFTRAVISFEGRLEPT
jgi:hypothetical protein